MTRTLAAIENDMNAATKPRDGLDTALQALLRFAEVEEGVDGANAMDILPYVLWRRGILLALDPVSSADVAGSMLESLLTVCEVMLERKLGLAEEFHSLTTEILCLNRRIRVLKAEREMVASNTTSH